MTSGRIAAFGVSVIMMAVMLLASPHPVFADSYEKSQAMSQVNECGNYWFPVNIICDNLNSQVQGDENDAAMAAAATPDSENTDSDMNYGTPFP
jgi:hypothetical protein